MSLVGRSFARDTFTRALSADAFVRAMLDFERALALAEGDVGIVPQDAARVIARTCSDLSLSPEALAAEGKRSGSLAVPLVKALTEPSPVPTRARRRSFTTARRARTSSTPRWSCA